MNPENIPPKPIEPVQTRKKKALLWPIVLMAWPAVALIATIFLYAVVNFAFSASTTPTDTSDAALYEPESPVRTVLNIVLFMLGGSTITLGPISFIVGLVLLIINLNKKQ